MNLKEDVQKDFLRLQRILRELRFLRYNNLTNPVNRKRIEDSIQTLGKMSDELKVQLEALENPTGDYDV